MSTYSQLPGVLNLSVKSGDDFATTVDFDLDLTGYTTYVSVSSLVSGNEITPVASEITNGNLGQVGIYMTDTQTSSLAPGSYKWSMRWVAGSGDVRTAIGGIFEVIR